MTHQSIRLAHVLTFFALASLASGDLSAQRGGGRGGGRGAGQARPSTGTHHRSGHTRHAGASGSHHRTGTQSAASRSGSHRNVSASNVNRGNGNRVNNGNINTGNVNVNVNGGHGHGYGYGYHPVARGVVAGATTAAIMGHYYSTLPTGCAVVNQAGFVYHHCGSTWYRNDGNQYVVVQQP
jgi:hypothetical protein